jgi:hypothetical protein
MRTTGLSNLHDTKRTTWRHDRRALEVRAQGAWRTNAL